MVRLLALVSRRARFLRPCRRSGAPCAASPIALALLLATAASAQGPVVIVDARPDKNYFRRLADALPPGCGIAVAGLADLPRLLREVGIDPAASPGGPP